MSMLKHDNGSLLSFNMEVISYPEAKYFITISGDDMATVLAAHFRKRKFFNISSATKLKGKIQTLVNEISCLVIKMLFLITANTTF